MAELWVNLNKALEFYSIDPNDDDIDKAWIISIRRYLKSEAVEMPTYKPTRSEIRRLAIQQEVFSRKCGEWIETPYSRRDAFHAGSPTARFHCSVCKHRTGYKNAMKWVYCPYCGADMRKKENDNDWTRRD